MLTIEELPSPPLGDDQVRIRVLACGINFPDVLMVAGKYQAQPPMPFTPGAECCGEIVEVGSRCRHLHAGQRVMAVTGSGALAEEVCVPEAAAVPISAAVAVESAAGFLLAYGTAYHALKQRARLAPGESLLVIGAAGGVGLAAVQLGKLLGARVIAAASSDAKLELARRNGADDVINYAEHGLRDAVRERTGGRGVDVIFDPVGGALFDDCLRSIAWNGRILVIGFAGGSIQDVPANLPLLKGSSVVGVFWGRFAANEPEQNRQNTEELIEWLVAGRIRPHVAEVFPLAKAATALERLASRHATGKVIVRIA